MLEPGEDLPGPEALAGCAFPAGLVFGYMPARKAAALDQSWPLPQVMT
jgi:hypothetical protein